MDYPFNAASGGPDQWGRQFSKQSARPSAAIVAAPLMIDAARLRVNELGFEAERFLGDGKIAAKRAD